MIAVTTGCPTIGLILVSCLAAEGHPDQAIYGLAGVIIASIIGPLVVRWFDGRVERQIAFAKQEVREEASEKAALLARETRIKIESLEAEKRRLAETLELQIKSLHRTDSNQQSQLDDLTRKQAK